MSQPLPEHLLHSLHLPKAGEAFMNSDHIFRQDRNMSLQRVSLHDVNQQKNGDLIQTDAKEAPQEEEKREVP